MAEAVRQRGATRPLHLGEAIVCPQLAGLYQILVKSLPHGFKSSDHDKNFSCCTTSRTSL